MERGTDHRSDERFNWRILPVSSKGRKPAIGRPPVPRSISSREEYHSTLFHELIHSTGHPSRVGREGIMTHNPFGSDPYSKEELVAEMGAAMLCGVVGIESRTLGNSAAYLQTWINRLKSDARLIISAASHAQKATDYVLGKTSSETETSLAPFKQSASPNPSLVPYPNLG